ncbi:MAG: DUF2520 domain-containing protein [Gammaproteobacteria bacterium]|nr:DUF2520 domain-containing protein [Gammaproteobacteria bacterium]
MSERPHIAIIGGGRVGASLAYAFAENGHTIKLGVTTRDGKLSQPDWGQYSPQNNLQVCQARAALAGAKTVLLTVADQQIKPVCEALSSHLEPSSVVAHCSGILGSDVLAAAADHGMATASVHPLASFPSVQAGIAWLSTREHGCYCYSEGDESALQALEPLFAGLGFKTRRVNPAAKPLYHAASVFACNYLNVLIELSLQCGDAADLERNELFEALRPLIDTTLANIASHGTTAALSGPVMRADLDTLSLHSQALAKIDPALEESYRDLGRHAVALAAQSKTLSDQQLKALLALLKKP